MVLGQVPDTPPAIIDGGGDGALATVLRLILEHPFILLAIIAPVGLVVGWKQLQRYYLERKGRMLPPLGFTITRIVRFAFLDDTVPAITRPAGLAKRLAWLQWRYVYLVWLLLTIASAVQLVRDDIAVTSILVSFSELTVFASCMVMLVLVFVPRARKVFRVRNAMMQQMFDLAAAEMRYPKDAALNPWAWVRITRWESITRPSEVHIRFPAGYHSEDLKVRDTFERNFSGSVSDENSFKFAWDSPRNRVTASPTPYLPRYAPHPGPSVRPWNEIPLGLTYNGEEAVLDVLTTPHTLIAGPTGSGKSITQRTILTAVLSHPEWRVIGIDPKMVELSPYESATNFLTLARTLEEATQVLESAEAEMKRRYSVMTELGVNNADQLPVDPETGMKPPAIMIIVDETYSLLAAEKVRSEEGKARDEMHARCTVLLSSIGRLGRAAKIFAVAATQRPDSASGVIPGELRNNLDARIACARMDTTPSLMVLDSDHATRLPLIKGRSILRLGGDYYEYQGYYLEQDQALQWAEQMLIAYANGSALDDTFEVGQDGAAFTPPADSPAPDAQDVGVVASNVDTTASGVRGWWARRQAAAQAHDAELAHTQATTPVKTPRRSSASPASPAQSSTRRRWWQRTPATGSDPAAAGTTPGTHGGLLLPGGPERDLVTAPWAGPGSGWENPGPPPPRMTDTEDLSGAVQPSMFADQPAPETGADDISPNTGAPRGPLPTAPVTPRLSQLVP